MRHGRRLLLGLLLALPATAGLAASCPPADTVALQALRDGAYRDGATVTVEGVVTGRFMDRGQLGGFYLQQAGSPPSALFVYAPDLAPASVRPGRQVQVTGRFGHHHGRPQLARPTALHDCGAVGLPAPWPLRLPEEASRKAELAGVKVHLDQPLTVSGNYELARFGTLTLSAGGRLLRERSAEAEADQARRIELDDGSYRRDPRPIPWLDDDGTRRSGSTVHDLTGILEYAFDRWRLHPTRTPRFVDDHPRPAPPPRDGAGLRVATFNVENYFVTLGARGAADAAARARQQAKLRSAVEGLDADLLAVVEVENRRAALDDLVALLNRDQPAARHYRAVAHPHSGSDAIQVALLYRPARLELLGAEADRDPVHHRAPLLGWFQPRAGGAPFGVVAVHFKSKVGCPRSGDVDRGEGCWNRRRVEQAEALAGWLGRVRRDGLPVVVAGDLNAYAAEAPLLRLADHGKRDPLATRLPAARNYSYVFRGGAGRLDYLLTPAALAGRVVDGGIWHINADEPPFLAYDGEQPSPGPWRASDHDPVWVDLAQ